MLQTIFFLHLAQDLVQPIQFQRLQPKKCGFLGSLDVLLEIVIFQRLSKALRIPMHFFL